jgi:hypothetical protein
MGAKSPRSKCQQCLFLARAVKEGSVLGLSPWLVNDLPLPVILHVVFYACLCVQISPFYDALSYIGLGLALMTHFNLITCVKTLSLDKVPFGGPGS